MTCDDCCESPCVCETAAKWITDRIREGRGEVTFFTNTRGDVGVRWWTVNGFRQAFGDTAEEAIASAEAAT
jgi:hypothetical protein